MPIPTTFDRRLAEVDNAAACVLLRLRNLHYAGPNRDPASVREALQTYADLVVALANDQ